MQLSRGNPQQIKYQDNFTLWKHDASWQSSLTDFYWHSVRLLFIGSSHCCLISLKLHNIHHSFARDDNAECRQPTVTETPGIQTDCKCILGGYKPLINAVVLQHADRSILCLEPTSRKSRSDKELIRGGKRWIWFWRSVSNWAHERYWRGARAGATLLY